MHRWWHWDAQLAFHPDGSVTVSLNLSAMECTETFLNLQKMCVGAVGETHVGPVWETFVFLCLLHWTHVQADEFPSRRIIQTLSFHCCIPDVSRPGKKPGFFFWDLNAACWSKIRKRNRVEGGRKGLNSRGKKKDNKCVIKNRWRKKHGGKEVGVKKVMDRIQRKRCACTCVGLWGWINTN